jgi:hypothetical protein
MCLDSQHQLVLVKLDSIVHKVRLQALPWLIPALQVLTVLKAQPLLRFALLATIKNGKVKENALSVLWVTTVCLVRDFPVQMVTYVREGLSTLRTYNTS